MTQHAPLAIPYVALFILVRAWFLPGLIAGEDFHPLDWSGASALAHYLPWPGNWNDSVDLGLPTDFWMPMDPLLFVAGLLAHAGFGWPVIERLLFLFPLFVLLPLGPYMFVMRLTRSPWAASASALVFAVNTWVIGLIERGHLPALIAYACMPLALMFLLDALRTFSRRSAVLFSLVILLEGTYEIRYAYLTIIAAVIFIAVHLLKKPREYMTLRVLGLAGSSLAVIVVGSLYWLIPMIAAPVSLPSNYATLHEFAAVNEKLSPLYSFSLFYPFYHHMLSNDGFHYYPVEWTFIVIGLLAALGLVACRKQRYVGGLTSLWIVGTIFVSGSSGVFGALNQWVFAHVPGMSAFRDALKLMCFSNVAASAAIGLLLARVARFDLPGFNVSRRLARASLVVLFCAFYLFAVRDAYNPLRLSNFAASSMSSGDRQMRAYLTGVPSGRVLFFPAYPPWYINEDERHPAVEAGYLAQAAWSLEGLGALSSDPGDIFAFYGSPLMNSLLCETGVRYVAIMTDPNRTFFAPWNYPMERAEVDRFFKGRTWLRPVTFSSGRDPEAGGPTLYQIKGCSTNPERLGFVAKYPVLFNGSSQFAEALAGSVFWRSDPAVALATQQRSLSAYQALENVVSAPLLYASEGSSSGNFALPIGDQRALNAEGTRRIQYEDRPFRGYAFSSRAEAAMYAVPYPPGFIKQSFDSRGGDAELSGLITPRLGLVQTIAVAKELSPLKTARHVKVMPDPTGFAVDPVAGVVQIGSPPGWLMANTGGESFSVINPLSRAVHADIFIPGAVALSGLGLPYTVNIAGSSGGGFALPLVLEQTFSASIPFTLRGVLLQPGSNEMTVLPHSAANTPLNAPSALAIDPRITVENIEPLGIAEPAQSLAVTVTRSGMGSQIAAFGPHPSIASSEARFNIVSVPSVPLSERPQLTFRYSAPQAPANFKVALGLDGPGGAVEYEITLPRGLREFRVDPYNYIQHVIDVDRQEQETRHNLDYRWLRADARLPRIEVSRYTLKYVDLILYEAATSDMASASGLFGSLTVSNPATAFSAPSALSVSASSQDMMPTNLRLENASISRVKQKANELSITAALRQIPQEAIPSDLQVGDDATVTLANGSTVAGVVQSVKGDYIVFKEGNAYIGLRRTTIAAIDRVNPRVKRSFSFDIPLHVPSGATDIVFRTFIDPSLVADVRLLVQSTANGKIEEVFPQDRLALSTEKPQLPSQWVSPWPDLNQLTASKTGIINTSAELRTSIAFGSSYDLPLDAILRSEGSQISKPRVVGLRFSFEAAPTDTLGSRDVTVTIRSLAAVSATRFARTRISDAVVMIDDLPVRLHPTQAAQTQFVDGSIASAKVALSAGRHQVISRQDGAADVDSLLVSTGKPVANEHAAVSGRAGGSWSERVGELDSTAAGLFVMPTTYARPWRLALVPASFVATGNEVVDYFRLRDRFLPEDRHLMVNGGLNAWLIPKHHGTVVLLYESSVYSRLAIVLELALVVLLFALRRAFGWLR